MECDRVHKMTYSVFAGCVALVIAMSALFYGMIQSNRERLILVESQLNSFGMVLADIRLDIKEASAERKAILSTLTRVETTLDKIDRTSP